MNTARNAILAFALAFGAAAHAQPAVQTGGAVLVIPAFGEVTEPNDEARAAFSIEEQDKDKAAAASRVNLKMKQGLEILRREDRAAKLRTRGYYTYPVYAEDQPRPTAKPQQRQLIGWRVGQSVEMTTTSLDTLPRAVASAQRVLALNGLDFHLSKEAQRRIDRARIEAAYRNLTERIASTVHAMGRDPADAIIDTVDFEGTGNYVPPGEMSMRAAMAPKAAAPAPVEEPSFEPGETTMTLRVVGRVKLR